MSQQQTEVSSVGVPPAKAKPLGAIDKINTARPPVAQASLPVIKTAGQLVYIPLDRIELTGWNPRTTFDPDKLNELRDSILAIGVQQPVLVRPKPDSDAKNPRFQLIFGERRFKASLLAKRETIPAIVSQLSDEQVVERMVVENGQRDDLHPFEEARGYARLRDQFNYTATMIAAAVSMSKRHVETRLQLMQLCPDVQQALLAGTIDVTRASLLVRIPDPKLQVEAMKIALKGDPEDLDLDGFLTSRQLEDYIAENYTRALRGVPWKLDDAKLDPRAGACASCPKNARNMDGKKNSDVCTDLACFLRKQQAATARRIEGARAIGQRVIQEPHLQINERWNSQTTVTAGEEKFVRLTDRCHADRQGRNWRDLLGKTPDGLQKTVLIHTAAGVVEAVPAQVAIDKVKDAGLLKADTSLHRSATEKAATRAEQARNKLQRAVAYKAVADLVGAGQNVDQVLMFVLARELCRYTTNFRTAVMEKYGIKEPDEIDDAHNAIVKLKRQQIADLLLQLSIGDPCDSYGGFSTEFDDAVEFFRIDLRKIEARAKTELAKPSSAKSDCRAGILPAAGAVALNEGRSINAPPGANAIIAKYSGDKKAHVLFKDVDTLKGAGVPTKVTFGRVPFDNKKRPQWAKFQEVK